VIEINVEVKQQKMLEAKKQTKEFFFGLICISVLLTGVPNAIFRNVDINKTVFCSSGIS
jgi:hypothetical protein